MEGELASLATLAFMPRALARELVSFAAGGASPSVLLEMADELNPSGSWRPGDARVREDLEALKVTGTRLIFLQDSDYPALLRQTVDPPLCL